MVVAIQGEASVVDEELLAQALVEEVSPVPSVMQDSPSFRHSSGAPVSRLFPRRQEPDGKDKMRTMGLPDMILQATSLKLSFRHIRKVDNLQGFRCENSPAPELL
jgi:hypothetical protein